MPGDYSAECSELSAAIQQSALSSLLNSREQVRFLQVEEEEEEGEEEEEADEEEEEEEEEEDGGRVVC